MVEEGNCLCRRGHQTSLSNPEKNTWEDYKEQRPLFAMQEGKIIYQQGTLSFSNSASSSPIGRQIWSENTCCATPKYVTLNSFGLEAWQPPYLLNDC